MLRVKIYKKVSTDEKFRMGFTLGYALKSDDILALPEKPQLVKLPALLPSESKPNKKKITTAASLSTPNKENQQESVAVLQPVTNQHRLSHIFSHRMQLQYQMNTILIF